MRLEFQLGCFPWKARVLNESTTLKTSAYIGSSILDLSRHFGMIAITITSGINTTIKISYLHKTSTEDLVVTKDVSCEVKQDNFSQTFAELAHMIMSEKNFQIPSNLSQAEHLYIDLLGFIEDMY